MLITGGDFSRLFKKPQIKIAMT